MRKIYYQTFTIFLQNTHLSTFWQNFGFKNYIQTVEMDDDDVSEEIEIIEYDDNVNIIDRIVIHNFYQIT